MKIDFHRERLCVLLELERSQHYKNVDYLSVERRSDDASSRRRRAEDLLPAVHRGSDRWECYVTVHHRQTMGEWFLEVRMNPLLHRLAAQETTGLKAQPNMSASCKYT